MHLALVMQFAAIIIFRGVIVVSCNKVVVVANHGVTASGAVTRTDLTFCSKQENKKLKSIHNEQFEKDTKEL